MNGQSFGVVTFHPDLALILPGLGEIVSRLHLQPRFRCAAKRF